MTADLQGRPMGDVCKTKRYGLAFLFGAGVLALLVGLSIAVTVPFVLLVSWLGPLWGAAAYVVALMVVAGCAAVVVEYRHGTGRTPEPERDGDA